MSRAQQRTSRPYRSYGLRDLASFVLAMPCKCKARQAQLIHRWRRSAVQARDKAQANESASWNEILGLVKQTRGGWGNANVSFEYWSQVLPSVCRACFACSCAGEALMIDLEAHLCAPRHAVGGQCSVCSSTDSVQSLRVWCSLNGSQRAHPRRSAVGLRGSVCARTARPVRAL